jgi:hypothetical protein
MSVDTYYTVLGVPETATQADIKAAYRNLIKQVHPDTLPQTSPYWRKIAEDKAKELTEAYTVLSDRKQRAVYDGLLNSQQSAPPRPPDPPRYYNPPPQPAPAPQKLNVQRKSNSGWVWLGLFIVLFIIWLFSESDKDQRTKGTSAATSPTPASSTETATAPIDFRPKEVKVKPPLKHAAVKHTPTPVAAPISENEDLQACLKSGACKPFTVQEPPPKSKPKPVALYATVTGKYASIDKRCAFLPLDNYGRCGFGPETIARLQSGDRVRVLSPKVRAENGDDIYKVRTQQGWEGWIESTNITLEER